MKRLTKIVFIGLVSGPAYADLTPKSHVGIAGIEFQSQVGTQYGNNDNVTYQTDSTAALESNYWEVSPLVQALGERDEDKYLLMYQGKYRHYEQSEADDFERHFMMFEGTWRFGLKHGLKWNIEQTYDQEERGTELTEGFSTAQLNQYGLADSGVETSMFDTSLRYDYGALEGRGKFSLQLQTKSSNYGDIDAIKIADNDFYQYALEQQWREDSAVVELFDQYSDDTRFRYSFITNRRYYEINELKNSDEYYLLFGINSRRSAKTTLIAEMALLYKEFINNLESENFLGINWNIEAQWKPVSYSTFSLKTSQRVKDPTQEGGYILDGKYGVSWKYHWWVDRVTTTLSYQYETEDYKMVDNNRYDVTKVTKLAVGYDFRPSVRFELNYQWSHVHSNESTETLYIGAFNNVPIISRLGYDQSIIELQLKVQI